MQTKSMDRIMIILICLRKIANKTFQCFFLCHSIFMFCLSRTPLCHTLYIYHSITEFNAFDVLIVAFNLWRLHLKPVNPLRYTAQLHYTLSQISFRSAFNPCLINGIRNEQNTFKYFHGIILNDLCLLFNWSPKAIWPQHAMD